MPVLSCDFEVFGTVQGVSFRYYTQQKAQSIGVRGWCMNTENETVKGQMEAEPEQFEEMKKWLRMTGSPSSYISKAVFSDTKELQDFTFTDFEIKK